MKYLLLAVLLTLTGCPVDSPAIQEDVKQVASHTVVVGTGTFGTIYRTIDLETGIVCYYQGHQSGINCFQFEETFQTDTPSTNHL